MPDDDEWLVAAGPFVVPTAEEIVANVRRLSALAGAHFRATSNPKDRSWIRPSFNRRVYDGRTYRLVRNMAWPDRWTQAGGPYMQQQAVLRTVTLRACDAQAELPKKGQKKT